MDVNFRRCWLSGMYKMQLSNKSPKTKELFNNCQNLSKAESYCKELIKKAVYEKDKEEAEQLRRLFKYAKNCRGKLNFMSLSESGTMQIELRFSVKSDWERFEKYIELVLSQSLTV